MVTFNHLPLELQLTVYFEAAPEDRPNMLQALGRHHMKRSFEAAVSRLTGNTLPALPSHFPNLTSVTLLCSASLLQDLLKGWRTRICTSILPTQELEISAAPEDYINVTTFHTLLSTRRIEIWGIKRLVISCVCRHPLQASNVLLSSCEEIQDLRLSGPEVSFTHIPPHICAHLARLDISSPRPVCLSIPHLPSIRHLALTNIRATVPLSGMPGLDYLSLDNAHINNIAPHDLVGQVSTLIAELRVAYTGLTENEAAIWLDISESPDCKHCWVCLDEGCAELTLKFYHYIMKYGSNGLPSTSDRT